MNGGFSHVQQKICSEFLVFSPHILQAITQDKQDMRNMYECPVYKTRTRGPTYVWTFNLKSKDKPAKWTLAGVALLLQV
jgi:dynein heavy chain